jgi:hypothetical protein
MLQYLFQDTMFKEKFRPFLALFEADRYTFFALVYSISGQPKEAIEYLMKSFETTPKVLIRKRFWASLRHGIFGLFRKAYS